jgi:integrase
VKNPKQPFFTGDVVTRIVATPRKKRRMFFTLCAAAGLRFGETLGIDIKNISQDCTTIKIKQKVWRNQVRDFLKNEENGQREIDLHSFVAAMLREFIGERKTGLLFCSRTVKPLQQSNILRRRLQPVLKQLNWKDSESGCTTTGSHAFRRFRNTHLRNFTSTPPSLIKFWLGHAGQGQDMSDLYDKAKNDVQFRKEVAERAGLGLELPAEKSVVGPKGLKIENEVALEMAASV